MPYELPPAGWRALRQCPEGRLQAEPSAGLRVCMSAPLHISLPKRPQEPLSRRAVKGEAVNDDSIPQMEDAVAGGEEELRIVRDGEYDASRLCERSDCGRDSLHVLPVQVARRLVKEIEGSLIDDSVCYREALLLSSRKCCGMSFPHIP